MLIEIRLETSLKLKLLKYSLVAQKKNDGSHIDVLIVVILNIYSFLVALGSVIVVGPQPLINDSILLFLGGLEILDTFTLLSLSHQNYVNSSVLIVKLYVYYNKLLLKLYNIISLKSIIFSLEPYL
jgi:hypothetical protein